MELAQSVRGEPCRNLQPELENALAALGLSQLHWRWVEGLGRDARAGDAAHYPQRKQNKKRCSLPRAAISSGCRPARLANGGLTKRRFIQRTQPISHPFSSEGMLLKLLPFVRTVENYRRTNALLEESMWWCIYGKPAASSTHNDLALANISGNSGIGSIRLTISSTEEESQANAFCYQTHDNRCF